MDETRILTGILVSRRIFNLALPDRSIFSVLALRDVEKKKVLGKFSIKFVTVSMQSLSTFFSLKLFPVEMLKSALAPASETLVCHTFGIIFLMKMSVYIKRREMVFTAVVSPTWRLHQPFT